MRNVIDTATQYWASHLGCSPDELFASPMHLVTHGEEWDDYDGVFALFRGDESTVSLPPARTEALRELLPTHPVRLTPETLASALSPLTERVVGPAYIGYATEIPPPTHPARALGPDDAAALSALAQACAPLEWEHGGSAPDHPSSGIFVDGQLAALAGYEVWGGAIAHIAIVTHPAFRQQGYARSAVAHLAQRALAAGLLPQYRTLESNRHSVHIAQALGFEPFGRSLSIRFRP